MHRACAQDKAKKQAVKPLANRSRHDLYARCFSRTDCYIGRIPFVNMMSSTHRKCVMQPLIIYSANGSIAPRPVPHIIKRSRAIVDRI